jgi:hypothetical protein
VHEAVPCGAELRATTAQFGLETARAFMRHVQDSAEESVCRVIAGSMSCSCSRQSIDRATVGATDQPKLSPKEVFAAVDAQHLVIARIASPASVRHILSHDRVCVSFIDIFVHKGSKVGGSARPLGRNEAGYVRRVGPLSPKARPRFIVNGVIVVQAQSVEPIMAQSCRLYPPETTEVSQLAAALQIYRVRPRAGCRSAGPAQCHEPARRHCLRRKRRDLGCPARGSQYCCGASARTSSTRATVLAPSCMRWRHRTSCSGSITSRRGVGSAWPSSSPRCRRSSRA